MDIALVDGWLLATVSSSAKVLLSSETEKTDSLPSSATMRLQYWKQKSRSQHILTSVSLKKEDEQEVAAVYAQYSAEQLLGQPNV